MDKEAEKEMNHASLCVLTFNRPDVTRRSLRTLSANTRAPYELIILDDGSNDTTQAYLGTLIRQHAVSTVLFNTDRNLGIGIAVNRGFQIARGDYLFKLDADLMYEPGWLTESMRLLQQHKKIGCLGLFKYWHKPRIFSENIIETYLDYYEVVDFVGSAIGMRREVYDQFGPWFETSHTFGEDKQFKMAVQAAGFHLALPKNDLAQNVGFGEYKTSLIKEVHMDTGKHIYHVPFKEPLIFGKRKQLDD